MAHKKLISFCVVRWLFGNNFRKEFRTESLIIHPSQRCTHKNSIYNKQFILLSLLARSCTAQHQNFTAEMLTTERWDCCFSREIFLKLEFLYWMMSCHDRGTEASVMKILSLKNNGFAVAKQKLFSFLLKTIQVRFPQADVFLCQCYVFLSSNNEKQKTNTELNICLAQPHWFICSRNESNSLYHNKLWRFQRQWIIPSTLRCKTHALSPSLLLPFALALCSVLNTLRDPQQAFRKRWLPRQVLPELTWKNRGGLVELAVKSHFSGGFFPQHCWLFSKSHNTCT